MSFTVDTTGFTKMVQSLSKMSGTQFAPVVRAETGKILEGCVRRTKVTSAANIRTGVAYRNRTLWEKGQWPPSRRGDPIISETKDGRIWFIDEPSPRSTAKGKRLNGKVFYNMSDNRYGAAREARFASFMGELQNKQTDLARALRARGLTAHSWYQIAQSLGLDISVPGYVRNAQPYSGATYHDGTSLEHDQDPAQFFIDISNANPFLVSSGGAAILQSSVIARIDHYNIALQKGTFENIKSRAEQFPGVFVR